MENGKLRAENRKVVFNAAKNRALFFILHSLVAFILISCGGPQATRTAGGTVLDISPEIIGAGSDTTIMVGKIRAGEIIQYEAWLRNTGSYPFVITGVDTSCGCTTVEYEKNPIPAGEKGRFSFRFDSRGMAGMQMKVIDIRTSLGNNPYRLFMHAEVENPDL